MTKTLAKISLAVYFLIGMHPVAPSIGETGLYLTNNIIGWVIIGTLIGISFWHLSIHGNLQYSLFLIISIVAFLLLIVPMYYRYNFFAEMTTYRMAFLAGGIIFYLSILQFGFGDKEKKSLLYLFLIAAVIQSVIGIFQYYGSPWGSFGHKDVMTVFMATGISISLFYLNFHHDFPYGTVKKYLSYLIYVMPFTGALILSVAPSTVAYAGLFVAIVLQVSMTKFKDRSIQIWFGILLLGILTGWLIPESVLKNHQKPIVENQTEDREKNQSGQVGKKEENSVEALLETLHPETGVLETTWSMIKENPLTGVGYGGWERNWRRHVAKRKRNEPDLNYRLAEPVEHPGNEMLLWISEGGLIVFVSFLVFFGGYFNLVRKLPLPEVLSHLGLISPILLHAIIGSPFLISVAHWIVFLLLILIYDKPKPGYEIKSKLVMLLPALAIPILVCYNMAVTYKNLHLLTELRSTDRSDKYEVLQKIGHPGPLYKEYEYDLLKSMLDEGLKNNDKDLLLRFIERAEEFIEYNLHIHVHQWLYTANKALKKDVAAWGWQFKARRLYPDPYEDTAWLYNDDDIKRKEEKEKKLAEKLKETESFLLNNKNNNPDIVETPSGLQYRIIKKGTGRTPKRKSKVKVNYSGPFFNLDQYNSYTNEGRMGELETDKLIDGWKEGMLLMKEGGEFEFFIHPKLGYGKQGRRGVPGNACLIFNVRLIEILE